MAGANSPASLASRPVGMVLFDEPDRYPSSAGAEGDPCDLGERRMDGFPYPKSVYFSTPTKEGASKISEKYEQTDKRKYYVPCPHCGYKQSLEWEQLKWEEDGSDVIPSSVRYICMDCGEGIPESKKSYMIMNGEWRETAKAKRPGFVGFEINSLYSPFKSWLDRIYVFKEAKGKQESLQVFYNTVLGRLWKERGDAPDWERVYAHRKNYRFNIVPSGGSIILAGVDVQDDRIEIEIKAYGPNMMSWSIDYRKLIGPTAEKEVWGKLFDLLNEEFEYEEGGKGSIFRMALDSGYRTTQTYNFARQFGYDRVMVVKGSSQRFAQMVSTPKQIDRDHKGNKIPGGVYLTIIGTDAIKSEIYQSLRTGDKNKEAYGIMYFPDYEEEYFKQLTSESLIIRKLKNGAKRYTWELPPGVRNEVLDCNVYVRACAAAVGVDRWTPESHRKYYENMIQVKKVAKKQTENKQSRMVGRPIRYD